MVVCSKRKFNYNNYSISIEIELICCKPSEITFLESKLKSNLSQKASFFFIIISKSTILRFDKTDLEKIDIKGSSRTKSTSCIA